jgi:hypothetical protein
LVIEDLQENEMKRIESKNYAKSKTAQVNQEDIRSRVFDFAKKMFHLAKNARVIISMNEVGNLFVGEYGWTDEGKRIHDMSVRVLSNPRSSIQELFEIIESIINLAGDKEVADGTPPGRGQPRVIGPELITEYRNLKAEANF